MIVKGLPVVGMSAALVEPGTSSVVFYALSRVSGRVDDYVLHALACIRPLAERLVVIVPAGAPLGELARLRALSDDVVEAPGSEFDPDVYAWACAQETAISRFDEIVLTGDSWFGAIRPFAPVLERMAADTAPIWAMIENVSGPSEAFPAAGFPHTVSPWLWTVVRGPVLASAAWATYWSKPSVGSPSDRERDFYVHMRAAGYPVSYAFDASDYSTPDPALYASAQLLDDGCPVLSRTLFTKYPPFLDRFAVIGREVVEHVGELGFSKDLIWQNLARSIPPKSLYTIGGMLEVLPDVEASYDPSRPFRIAAIVHVADVARLGEILERLAHLPSPYDLFLTTMDGKRASDIQRIVEERADPRLRQVDVRVTPASSGRDMGDFFVGCRDVLLSNEYDLVLKLHARWTGQKTVNVERYFRRYQFDNLLNSPGYAANLLGLFQKEPGLGFVFPPMMHIGYSTMGRGWAGLQGHAKELAEKLGVQVPQDSVSPLAPYGGMFICRPQALILLSNERWRYGDYGRRGLHKYRNLAHLQERMVVSAGAELGYHSRTALTSEHAAISHTALESKVDHMFSTTRGWPVEQIQLLQKAGFAGHGGVVALSRMYVRLNHPRASRLLVPVYGFAFRAFLTLKLAREGAKGLFAALFGRQGRSDR